LLGVKTDSAENTLLKLVHYFRFDYTPNLAAVGVSLLVILIMVFLPKRINARIPGSLLGLIMATAVTVLLDLDVPVIGNIPQTILLDQRLLPSHIPWEHITELVMPALSIAALGSIESLLCGTVAGRMTGEKMDSSQELIAQGLGNIVIPFFGGVPATAAIARTSVAIKSGGTTRVMSLVHSAMLLLVVLMLAPVISHVPLAALAGVLAVTAWRMNEWDEIRDILGRRFKSAIFAFASTLIATIALDLTQAIILGVGLSAAIFVFQISRSKVILSPVSAEKMRAEGYEMQYDANRILVVYIMGPLFFGTVNTFNTELERRNGNEDIILSLRTVPLLDTTGISAIEDLIHRFEGEDRRVYLSGLSEPVRSYLERAGVLQHLGEGRIFWSADEAIIGNIDAPDPAFAIAHEDAIRDGASGGGEGRGRAGDRRGNVDDADSIRVDAVVQRVHPKAAQHFTGVETYDGDRACGQRAAAVGIDDVARGEARVARLEQGAGTAAGAGASAAIAAG
jgi:SulP family sulfate permease